MKTTLDALRHSFTPVLTRRVYGYGGPPTVGTQIIQPTLVDTLKVNIRKYGVDQFTRTSDGRSIGAAEKAVSHSYTQMEATLDEHSLRRVFDWREKQAAGEGYEDLQTWEANNLKLKVILNREKAIYDFLVASGNYKSGHINAVESGSQWNKVTNGVSDNDPIAQMLALCKLVIEATGLWPNIAWFGWQAWWDLINNTKVRDRLAYAPTSANMTPIVTKEMVASLLGVEKVVVGQAVESTDGSAFSQIWGDAAGVVYNRPGSPTDPLPTFAELPWFRFGTLASGEDVLGWANYRTIDEKRDEVVYTEVYGLYSAMNAAGAALTNTNQ